MCIIIAIVKFFKSYIRIFSKTITFDSESKVIVLLKTPLPLKKQSNVIVLPSVSYI